MNAITVNIDADLLLAQLPDSVADILRKKAVAEARPLMEVVKDALLVWAGKLEQHQPAA